MIERRRQYTRRQKAAIVGEAEVVGVRSAARRAGVPTSTVQSWRQRGEFAQLRDEKRDQVAQDVWAAFQMGVRRITELIPVTEDIAKVATATGIIYDKFALLSGQATERTENVSMTDGISEERKRKLRDMLDEAAQQEVTVS